MLRRTYPVTRRHGHSIGRLRDALPDDIETTPLDEGVAYTTTRPTRHGVLPQRLCWRVTPAGVETTAALSWVWGALFLVVAALVVAGTLVASVAGVALHVLATTVFVWLVLEATWAGYLSTESLTVETSHHPHAGVVSLVAVAGAAAVVADGVPALGASVVAAGISLAYTTTATTDRLSEPLAVWLSRLETTVPVAPRRHVLFAGCGATALVGFGALYVDVHLSTLLPSLTVALFGCAAVLTLLWTIDSRRAARTHVAAAVGVTVLSAGVALILARPTSTVSRGFETPTALVAQAVIAGALAGLWGLLAYHHVLTQTAAIDRFDASGRQVDTRTAAVLTYTVAISAVGLGCATVGWLGTLAVVVTTTGALAPVVVAIACAAPLGYFVAGAGYQLRELGRQLTAIRRLSDPISPDELDLPFDPAYDIRVVNEDGFLAGAYYDPALTAIVLSRETIEALSPLELAVVVAHEESHFVHRGAYLQFAFSLVCSIALVGKNVLYSLYDFREREFTADQYAVDRIGTEPFLSILDARIADELELADSQLVGFFPTMASSATGSDQSLPELFALFHGHSAGLVHPDDVERQAAITATDPTES